MLTGAGKEFVLLVRGMEGEELAVVGIRRLDRLDKESRFTSEDSFFACIEGKWVDGPFDVTFTGSGACDFC